MQAYISFTSQHSITTLHVSDFPGQDWQRAFHTPHQGPACILNHPSCVNVVQVQELQSIPRKPSLSLPPSPHSSNGEGGELRAANQQVWQLRAQLEAAQKVQPYRPFLDGLAEGARGQALKVHPAARCLDLSCQLCPCPGRGPMPCAATCTALSTWGQCWLNL